MVHEQNILVFNMKGQEELKHRVLTKASSCAGQCSAVQEADACTTESWAVWILSLKLQLPESGEGIISARLGFCLVIVLLETGELCTVSAHLPNLNAGQENLKYTVRGLLGFFPAMCSSWGLKENTVHSSACCKITRACMLGVNNPTQSAAGCAGGRLPHAPSLMVAPRLGQKQNPTAYCRTPC